METPEVIAELQYQKDHIDETHVPSLLAGLVCALVIAYAAVFLRLISRYMGRTQLKWDDWLIILSLVFTNGFILCDCGLVSIGYGRHSILVTKPIVLNKVVLAAEVIYTWGILSFKMSALFLLRRIFPGKRFKHVLYAIGAFVLALSIMQTFGIIFTCIPVSATFNPAIKGRCINQNNLYLVYSAFNIATDVIIIALPLPKLWKLNVSKTKKIQLTCIFTLGSCVCIISIVRTTYLERINLLDVSYTGNGAGITSALEMGIGTMSACLPTYGPLLHYLSGRRTFFNVADSKLVPNSDPAIHDNHRRNLLDPDASILHSFHRIEDGNDVSDRWGSTIPLSDINHTVKAEKGSMKGKGEPALDANHIQVSTDLEQTTLEHPTRV